MKTISFFLVSFVLLAGCSSIKVQVNHDDTVDFASYKTFDFSEDASEVQGTLANARIVADLIQDDIENELGTKGFQRDENAPDLIVAYHASVFQHMQDYNPGRLSAWSQGSTLITPLNEGTLIVDIIDAGSNELIWRGTATGAVERGSSEEATKKVHDAVHKLLAKFPPR